MLFRSDEAGQTYVLQVRPITSNNHSFNIKKEELLLELSGAEEYITSQSKKHIQMVGNRTLFSDMSDWNPAEILGNHSNLLDYSLYDYLIMDKIWHQSRTKIGYQNIDPYPLMVRLGKKPYVDLRGSFNSLLPKTIQEPLKTKLINFLERKVQQFNFS